MNEPPTFACKDGCADCCKTSVINMSAIEWEMLQPAAEEQDVHAIYVNGFYQLVPKNRLQCPFLSAANKCTVYENRPFVCRLYGTITDAEFPEWVCTENHHPDPPLTKDQATDLFQAWIQRAIAGHIGDTSPEQPIAIQRFNSFIKEE
tara:strand:- start:18099 stop:18542 length:444 start_codon:yes stop_codon:yes gene_type:complete